MPASVAAFEDDAVSDAAFGAADAGAPGSTALVACVVDEVRGLEGDSLDWAKQVTDARPIKCGNTKRKIQGFQRRIRNMRDPLARRH